MPDLKPDLRPDLKIGEEIKSRFIPFMSEVVTHGGENIHSICITGSALTGDFDPRHSDINSIVVLHRMDLELLEWLAPLGKKYGKKKISAPLIMTPGYIRKSLDVFPVEFLNFKRIHDCLMGEDLFNGLEIKPRDLRNQCEKELKSKLILLRQNYISASGDRKLLTEEFIRSFSGYIPLFRGIITLYKGAPPLSIADVLQELEEVTRIDLSVFRRVHKEKKERKKLSVEELNTLFEEYYTAIEKIGDLVDELEV